MMMRYCSDSPSTTSPACGLRSLTRRASLYARLPLCAPPSMRAASRAALPRVRALTRARPATQNIFNLQGDKTEPCTLTPAHQSVTIRFRLEKVSRRKDNQRFRVQVEPLQSPGARMQLRGVMTRPICVLSKRKTGERMVAKRLGDDTVLVRSEVKDRSLGNAEFRNALRQLCDQVRCA